MEYIIRKEVLGSSAAFDITEEQFSQIESARSVLTNAFAFEEKYNIIVANYLDLDKELLSISAENMVQRALNYSDFFSMRAKLNVRVVNLLTATKLYLDQLPQNLSKCTPHDSSTSGKVRCWCSEQYDSNFEYRFMEALRNYVQHRGIPVHLARSGMSWTSIEDDGLLEFNTRIYTQKRYLEEDKIFKKSVLKEMPEEVDLILAVRKYVGCISSINESARKYTYTASCKARELIEGLHEKYQGLDPGRTIGLAAVALDQGRKVRSIPLLLDWDDVRDELMRRNSAMSNLFKRYVSSSPRKVRRTD